MSIAVVIRDRVDKLSIRHIDDTTKAEVTVSSGTATIYRGTTAVVTAATVIDTSSSLPGYSRTWDAATFPLGSYHAVWTLLGDDGITRIQDQYFQVVLRVFRCPIGISDFMPKYPYLTAQAPSGTTAATYLESAWDEIEQRIYGRFQEYPGNIFFTDVFRQTVEFWTVADMYQSLSRGDDTQDGEQAAKYREKAESSFEAAMAYIIKDENDNNVPDPNEGGIFTSGILIR